MLITPWAWGTSLYWLYPLFMRFRLPPNLKLEYYPYDKYKSPHTETPTSNREGGYSDLNFGQLKSEVFNLGGYSDLKLWSTQIWSLHWGGYSDLNFGQLKSEVFILGGVLWSETLVNSNLKSSFWRGGYSDLNFGQLKSEVFILGGVLWSEIPERGALENLDKNLLFTQKPACASQIVSHILRMWRLMILMCSVNVQ